MKKSPISLVAIHLYCFHLWPKPFLQKIAKFGPRVRHESPVVEKKQESRKALFKGIDHKVLKSLKKKINNNQKKKSASTF